MSVQWTRSIEGKGPICPICNQTGGCRISERLVVCTRVEAGSNRPLPDESGWMHELRGKQYAQAKKLVAESSPLTPSKIKEIVELNQSCLDADALDSFAKTLCVSVDSLMELSIGWDTKMYAWTFPMRGADGKFCGMYLIWPDGREGILPGSEDGLFVPEKYLDNPKSDCYGENLLLVTPKGILDTVACLDLKLRCIGRPSAFKCRELMRDFLRRSDLQDVVIVADRREGRIEEGKMVWDGLEGSLYLATHILDSCASLRFLVPPEGHGTIYRWARGESNGILKAIADLPSINRNWIAAAQGKIEKRRTPQLTPIPA